MLNYSGYHGDARYSCDDINECHDQNLHQDCLAHTDCVNKEGGYDCVCESGFEGDPYQGCTDIDECSGTNDCLPEASCSNYQVSFFPFDKPH